MKTMANLLRTSYLLLVLYSVFAVSPLVGNIDGPSRGGITESRVTASLRILAVERLLAAFLDGVLPEDSGPATDDDGFLVKKLRTRPVGSELCLLMSSANHLLEEGSPVIPEETPLLIHSSSHHPIGGKIVRPVEGYGKHFSGLAPPSLPA